MTKSILHIALIVFLFVIFLRHIVWLVRNWETNDTKKNILYTAIDILFILYIIVFVFF